MSRRAKPRRARRAALALLGAVLLVCCIGAAGLGLWNYQSVRRATGPAREAADAFLRDLAAGDPARAYDKLCGATRERLSREGLAEAIISGGKISRYAVKDVAVTTEGGQPKATVSAEVTRESGAVDHHKLSLIQEGDGWRVCGDPF